MRITERSLRRHMTPSHQRRCLPYRYPQVGILNLPAFYSTVSNCFRGFFQKKHYWRIRVFFGHSQDQPPPLLLPNLYTIQFSYVCHGCFCSGCIYGRQTSPPPHPPQKSYNYFDHQQKYIPDFLRSHLLCRKIHKKRTGTLLFSVFCCVRPLKSS